MKKHAKQTTPAVLSACAAVGLTLGHPSASQAAPVVYESFGQTAGDLNGQAGSGIGLAGNWSDEQTVSVEDTPTLSYGDLQNTGGQVRVGAGNSTDAWVTTSSALGDNGLLDDGATLWFSYMYEKASGGGANEWAGFAFGTDRLNASFSGANMTNSGNGVGLTTRDAGVRVATWSGGGNADQAGTLSVPLNTSVLIVGKVEWGATGGDDETITVYVVDPSDLGTLGTGASKTVAGFDQTLLDTISFTQRNAGNPGTSIYDEIRFGATLEDVTPVPEPSSLALLGLSALLVARRRRG